MDSRIHGRWSLPEYRRMQVTKFLLWFDKLLTYVVSSRLVAPQSVYRVLCHKNGSYYVCLMASTSLLRLRFVNKPYTSWFDKLMGTYSYVCSHCYSCLESL